MSTLKRNLLAALLVVTVLAGAAYAYSLRNVEALTASLSFGDVAGGDYTEVTVDGALVRHGAACNSKAEMSRTANGPVSLTLADTYYKVAGTYVGSGLIRFTVSAAGVATYAGPGECFILVGTSDLSVNKACETHYALYVNGALAPGVSETPHTFLAQNKITSVAIVGLVPLSTGDTLEVYAKSDTAGTDLDPATLKIVLFGS
jgi:hypothetical protein